MRHPKPTRRRFIKIAAAQSAALLAASLPQLAKAKSGAPKMRLWSGILLGADAQIQLHHHDARVATSLLKRCVSEIQRLENIFSLYDARSSLSQLNRDKTLDDAPPELLELILAAQRFGDKTNGSFDITIHPVIELYRAHFSTTDSKLPPPELESLLSAVDYRRIEVRQSSIALAHPNASVTLNGIAQGYITDRVAELLQSEGVSNTLVELGEKRALGTHPEGRPWRLALADSKDTGAEYDVVELENRALSSSGGYGTAFDANGRHHHLIDPRTGLSVNHHQAVHVLADTATTADALSTALATCRPDETATILARFPEAEARFGRPASFESHATVEA